MFLTKDPLKNKTEELELHRIFSVQAQKQVIKRFKEKSEKSQQSAKSKLVATTVIAVLFMAVEIVGGHISGSTSIFSDAAHLFSDFSGFGISLISIIMSKRDPTENMSYGYHRFEILGALFSILSIWLLSLGLATFAIIRIVNETYEVEEDLMLIIALIGLVCNLIMVKILHSGDGHSHHGIACSHSHKEEDLEGKPRTINSIATEESKNLVDDSITTEKQEEQTETKTNEDSREKKHEHGNCSHNHDHDHNHGNSHSHDHDHNHGNSHSHDHHHHDHEHSHEHSHEHHHDHDDHEER